jgi:hypothetical protein
MHIYKHKNFFKFTSCLLLVVSAVSIYLVAKSSKLENHVYLPSFYYGDLAQYGYEYITVQGTLISTGKDGIGSPLNSNEFVCDNSIKECNLVQADLSNDGFLSLYTESFPIESWDKNFIVFKTNPDNVKCVLWTYRIDRIKKELIGVREQAANYNHEECFGIGINKFEVKLVNGSDAISQMKTH